MTNLTTEISYDQLMRSWAPLADMSNTLDKCLKEPGTGNAREILDVMDDKIKHALEPLVECMNVIEKENPDIFS